MGRWIAIAVVLFAGVGCSSGGTTSASSTAPRATPPGSAPASTAIAAPGGLVGAIDQARVTAVCANAREAQTVLSVGGSAVTEPLAAAAGLLERPPVDPRAAAAGVAIRRDLAAGHANLALTEALSFCHSHGG